MRWSSEYFKASVIIDRHIYIYIHPVARDVCTGPAVERSCICLLQGLGRLCRAHVRSRFPFLNMGKHNGKARRTGKAVGSALVNKARKDGKIGHADSYLYTTDTKRSNAIDSIIQQNALEELMSMAELADRDFTADRGKAVVIKAGTTSVTAQEAASSEEERRKAEAENRDKLCVPRRPAWTSKMTADQLDAQERAYFLEWRRALAELEGSDRLVLTPFEKNLNVWRQLWRVIERSDIVVQVVDARDPLTYWNDDLQKYCLEIDPTKTSVLLMNKSDMVPEGLRVAWADYLDARKIDYLFWSAKQAGDGKDGDDEGVDGFDTLEGTASGSNVEDVLCNGGVASGDPRVRLRGVDELIEILKAKAAKAVREQELLRRSTHGSSVIANTNSSTNTSINANTGDMHTRAYMVGLIGYPNVGKSSTINALFGSKKTAVAATPGKTKHFQTLFVSEDLCLCDCPGLVMPRFAASKSDMVAAGVIPIDRLTDVIEPVEIIASRVKRQQLQDVYGITLKDMSNMSAAYPLARSLLHSIAASRGWSGAGGLPDMTRAGRRVLKDYVDGKILACKAPPESSDDVVQLAIDAYPVGFTPSDVGAVAGGVPATDGPSDLGSDTLQVEDEREFEEFLKQSAGKAKPIRPEYKFQKKTRKTKQRSGNGVTGYVATFDDELAFGKKGGLKR
jgi:large subunit GTPase 1